MNTCRLTAAGSLLAILLAGCGGGDAPEGAALRPQAAPQARTGPTAPSAPESNAGLPDASTSTRGGPLAGIAQDFGYSVDTQSREQVRLFYKTIFASSEGIDAGWTGNVGGCVPGTTSSEYKAAVLRRVNWFRAMAGVPATVQFDPDFSAKAQQAALYMSANNTLTHTPTSGACFNATVALAAGKSNIALRSSGVASVTNYIKDSGANNTVAGHRRWLLYPQTQLMGTGDITGSPQANAIWVQDTHYFDKRPPVRDSFVAWPAKGYSPYATTYARWSFAYPGADFSAATVSMKENGTPMSAPCLETVQSGYGENTLVWRPKCMADSAVWTKPTGDTTYEVTVSNVTGIVGVGSFTYNVIVFDPDVAGVGDGPITINGPGSIPAAQPASFTFAAQPGATSYAWRFLQSSDYSLNDGAEDGTGNFTVPVNPGYNIIANDVHASGTASFHLTHAPVADQSLLLNAELLAGAGTQLEFKSRLGAATTSEAALVEVSTDNGQSWAAVYTQVGTTPASSAGDAGELSFNTRTVSLAAFANRTIRIRFRFAMGSFYFPQSDSGIGWYLDDITVTGASRVLAAPSNETATPGFEFSRGNVTSALLQARPGAFGYFGDWGVIKAVTVSAAVVDPRDCLFNWAESQLPGVLAPHTGSFQFSSYYLRYYPAAGIYIGVGDVDNNVYYYASSGLVNLGNKGSWYAQAGCN